MNRLLSIVVTFALWSVLLPAFLFAQSQSPDFERLYDQALRGSGGELKLLRVSANGTPGILTANTETSVPLVSASYRDDAQAVGAAASAWMAMTANDMLGLPEDALLEMTQVNRSQNVWRTTFRLSYDGVPVRDRVAHLNIGALNGKIMMLRNALPNFSRNATLPAVSPAEAITTLLANEPELSVIKNTPELVYVENTARKELVLCYEVVAGSLDNLSEFRLTYDATTGELLERKSTILFGMHGSDDGHNCGVIHSEVLLSELHNGGGETALPQAGVSGRITADVLLLTPYDSLSKVGIASASVFVNGTRFYTDSLGYFNAPSATYPATVSTSFDGRFHKIERFDAANASVSRQFASGPADIHFDASNSSVSESSVYRSMQFAHDRVKMIDPALTELDRKITATVNSSQGNCNAYYMPSNRSLTFFEKAGSCNNFGLVADIVFHEYGHRINHARFTQNPGSGNNMQSVSLNEGFADLISSFLRDDPRTGVGFLSTNKNTSLRTASNTRQYPKDISSDPHETGLIISGAFWDLRQTLGLAATEQLFHLMCNEQPDGSDDSEASIGDAFYSVLMATLITDDDDNNLANGTPNVNLILEAFDKHNIGLTGLISLTASQIPDQDTLAASYPLAVEAEYSGPIGAIDPTSLRVYYRHSTDDNYQNAPLTFSSGTTYTGTIPKQPSGSIVEYYVGASTTLSASSIQTAPSNTASPLTFLVGYKRKFYNDLEDSAGWTPSVSSDAATTGRWTWGEPFGTFYDPTAGFVQQDTDRTVIGTHCFVTGNAQTTDPAADDVDGGSTTLVSPAFDLSGMNDPIVRFWYFFSNDRGANPGVSTFRIRLSVDGGSWRTVEQIRVSTDGWQQYTFRFKNVTTPSVNTRFQFTATDNSSLVEAGVDDLEILDAPAPEQTGTVPVFDADIFSLRVSVQPITRGNAGRITFSLPKAGETQIRLIDILGNTEQTIASEVYSEGEHSVIFSPKTSLASGVYLLELQTSYGIQRTKLIVL